MELLLPLILRIKNWIIQTIIHTDQRCPRLIIPEKNPDCEDHMFQNMPLQAPTG